MALVDRKILNPITTIQVLPDKPNASLGLTAQQLKEKFDLSPEDLRQAINGVIDDLLSTTDGASGADQIALTTIAGLAGTTVQTVLESIKASLDSSGGDITQLQADLAQEITDRTNGDLTLQGNIDAEEAARIAADLALQALIDTIEDGTLTFNGQKTFSTVPKSPQAPSADEDLTNKAYVDSQAPLTIPDGSIGDNKLEPAASTPEQTYFPFNVLATPTDALGIPTSMVGTGLTLQNLVENGDFSDGTNDWFFNSGTTRTVSGNTIETYGDGLTSANIRAWQNLVPMTDGDKWFVYGQAYLDSAQCIDLRIGLSPTGGNSGTSDESAVVTNPDASTWYELYRKVEITGASGIGTFGFRHQYSDEADATSSGFFKNMQAINMTALNIEHYTEEQMLELVRGGYIDGLKSASVDLDSFNKNLVWERITGYSVDPTNDQIFYDGNNALVCYLAKVDANTEYTISKPDGATDRFRIGFTATNPDVETITPCTGDAISSDASTEYTITSDGASKYMVVYVGFSNEFIRLQIEEGNQATNYVEPTSSPVTSSYELASLPNGVADTLDFVTGKLVKRIGKFIATSLQITSLVTSPTNLDVVYIDRPSDYVNDGTAITNDDSMLIEGFINGDYSDSTDSVGKVVLNYTSGSFALLVANGTYANLAAAQADLAGTVIYYELDTPKTIQTDLKGHLIPRQGGQITNDPLLKLEIEWPTNIQASLESAERALNRPNNIQFRTFDGVPQLSIDGGETWSTITTS